MNFFVFGCRTISINYKRFACPTSCTETMWCEMAVSCLASCSNSQNLARTSLESSSSSLCALSVSLPVCRRRKEREVRQITLGFPDRQVTAAKEKGG